MGARVVAYRVVLFAHDLAVRVALGLVDNVVVVFVEALGPLTPDDLDVNGLGVLVLLLDLLDELLDVAVGALEYGRILVDLALHLDVLDAQLAATELTAGCEVVVYAFAAGRRRWMSRRRRRMRAAAVFAIYLNGIGDDGVGRGRGREHRLAVEHVRIRKGRYVLVAATGVGVGATCCFGRLGGRGGGGGGGRCGCCCLLQIFVGEESVSGGELRLVRAQLVAGVGAARAIHELDLALASASASASARARAAAAGGHRCTTRTRLAVDGGLRCL